MRVARRGRHNLPVCVVDGGGHIQERRGYADLCTVDGGTQDETRTNQRQAGTECAVSQWERSGQQSSALAACSCLLRVATYSKQGPFLIRIGRARGSFPVLLVCLPHLGKFGSHLSVTRQPNLLFGCVLHAAATLCARRISPAAGLSDAQVSAWAMPRSIRPSPAPTPA